MKSSRSVVAGAAVAALLLTPAPVQAAPEPPLIDAKDCVEVSSIVSVDPAKAQAAVPGGYSTSSFFGLPGGPGIPGNRTLLMGVETCARGSVAGVPVDGPFAFGERVLSIDRKDGAPGYHFYAVEQVSNNQRLVDALVAAGYPAVFDPTVGTTSDRLGGVSMGGTVRIDATTPTEVPSPLSTVSIWHQSGPQARAFRLNVTDVRSSAGVAHIVADAGSPMANLLGDTAAVGFGAINRFDLVATLD